MGRKRRLRPRRSNSMKADGSGRAGGAGRNETERISWGADMAGRFGLKGEPGPGKGKILRAFMDRLYENASRPDFDREAYLELMAAEGAPKDLVEFVDWVLGTGADKEKPKSVAIVGALRDGDYDQAKRLVKEAELDGEDTSTYRYHILEWEGKMEEALALCESNIAGSKDDMGWIGAKADILNQMGRAEEWLELYEACQKRFGERSDWQAGRARALVAVGRLNEAEQIAVKAAESEEYPDVAWIALGEVLMARGDHEEATKLFNRVLDMDGDDDRGYIGKAEALAAMGRRREAVEVCDMRLSESKMSGHLKRVRDRILASTDGQGAERLKESHAGRAIMRRGSSPGDAEEMALTITLLCAMCRLIETAGVIRDLVYQQITEVDAEIRAGARILQAAMEQVPDDSQNVREAFLKAFRAAKSVPVPGVDATRQIVIEELEKFGQYPGVAERIYAAAGAFAAAFPDEALAAIRTRPVPKDGIVDFPQSRRDYGVDRQASCPPPPGLSAYQRILDAAYGAVRSDARVRRIHKNTPTKSWLAVARKIAEQAAAPNDTFPLCAAAAAVLVPRIHDRGMRYIGEHIKRDCYRIAAIMSKAGRIPPERATLIADAMLDGASAYPDDPAEAASEAAVRAIGEAHMQVSWGAAAAVLGVLFGIVASGLWRASDDRDRFDSMYWTALRAAGRMNPDMHLFFERMNDEDVKRPKDMNTRVWDFFYGASGLTMEEWADLVAGADYKAWGSIPENGRMMDECRLYYSIASAAAGEASAKERRS